MPVERDNNKLSSQFHEILGKREVKPLPSRRFKTKTEMNAENMIKDAKDLVLEMEIDNS